MYNLAKGSKVRINRNSEFANQAAGSKYGRITNVTSEPWCDAYDIVTYRITWYPSKVSNSYRDIDIIPINNKFLNNF